jgi:hypothetical protein
MNIFTLQLGKENNGTNKKISVVIPCYNGIKRAAGMSDKLVKVLHIQKEYEKFI